MFIEVEEIKDSKNHSFEVYLYKPCGSVYMPITERKECNSLQEALDFINILDRENKINYSDLTLDYNNKKTKNVWNLNDLISLVNQEYTRYNSEKTR